MNAVWYLGVARDPLSLEPRQDFGGNVFELLQFARDLVPHCPWNVQDVDVAGVAIGVDATLDDADERHLGSALVIRIASQPVKMTAHHFLAELGFPANLSLARKANSVVGSAICQPQQDQAPLRKQVLKVPHPALHLGAHE